MPHVALTIRLPNGHPFDRFTRLDSATPIIYSPVPEAASASVWARLLALAIGLGCLTVLFTAARLPPSRLGYGTHRQLHLPDCEFMRRTGLPCPSCGMTTSFSWFVRGNLAASLYVQPMGAVLAALACCTFWVGAYIAITGRPVYRLLELVPSRYLFIPLISFAICGWAWKIMIHLSGHDGW